MFDGSGAFVHQPVDVSGYGNVVLAEARGYVDIVMALRAQAERLGVPQLEIDAEAGVADGLSGHCLIGRKKLGPQSMGLIIQALGVKLLIVEDETAVPRIKRLLRRRRLRAPRPVTAQAVAATRRKLRRRIYGKRGSD